MADEQTTSFAKEVQLSPYQQSLLDRQAALSGPYNEAAAGREASQSQNGQVQDGGGRGSDMVRASAPVPELRPNNEAARAVDQEHFNQQWNAEAEKAKSYQEQLLERNQRLNDAKNNDNSVELSNDGRER